MKIFLVEQYFSDGTHKTLGIFSNADKIKDFIFVKNGRLFHWFVMQEFEIDGKCLDIKYYDWNCNLISKYPKNGYDKTYEIVKYAKNGRFQRSWKTDLTQEDVFSWKNLGDEDKERYSISKEMVEKFVKKWESDCEYFVESFYQ